MSFCIKLPVGCIFFLGEQGDLIAPLSIYEQCLVATVDVSAAAALLLLPGRKEATAAAAVREGWGRYHHGNRLKANLFRRFCCSNFKI